MHEYGFPVLEIKAKRMVFSAYFSGYDKGGIPDVASFSERGVLDNAKGAHPHIK